MNDEAEKSPPAALPQAGTLIGGKYHLERYLAEGGMGVIAIARHVELDERVALKFLKPELAQGELANRFIREARATTKVKSEHVPRILDVTKLESGVPYIVMELLEGQDLEVYTEKHGPLPVTFAVDLVLQALEALAAAHALAIVHRDFKPSNLFLTTRNDGSPCVKVLDFGIAKLADQIPVAGGADHGLTATGAVMGSPRYMAPEQMRASREVDARADVWSVGTSMYELLMGSPPFEGETLTHLCASILQDDPAPMVHRRPDVPPELEAIIRRCLEKQPASRWSSVAELAAALAPFGSGPAASESAMRVSRVLGGRSPIASQPSMPSISSSGAFAAAPGTTGPHQTPRGEMGPSPGVSPNVTNTSWGAGREGDGARQTRLRAILVASAALLLVGIAVGAFALTRESKAQATATSAHVTETAAPPASVQPAVSFATQQNEPSTPPTSGDVTTQATAPASAAPRATTTARNAGPTVAKTGATGPAPSPVGSAKAPPTAPSASKGNLWDDRK